jgi:hypothetical protein
MAQQIVWQVRGACLSFLHDALRLTAEEVASDEREQTCAGCRKHQQAGTPTLFPGALALCGVSHVRESFCVIDHLV